MVKFGEQMLEMRKAEWAAYYVAYTSLKDQLKPLAVRVRAARVSTVPCLPLPSSLTPAALPARTMLQECLNEAQEATEKVAAAAEAANQAPAPDNASVDSDTPTTAELEAAAHKAKERAASMEKVWFETLQMVSRRAVWAPCRTAWWLPWVPPTHARTTGGIPASLAPALTAGSGEGQQALPEAREANRGGHHCS